MDRAGVGQEAGGKENKGEALRRERPFGRAMGRREGKQKNKSEKNFRPVRKI
jgi:hypothetical protein